VWGQVPINYNQAHAACTKLSVIMILLVFYCSIPLTLNRKDIPIN
jgi:hypothetical protein